MLETGSHYDAIVIGGGPGGSAAATYLARAGQSVLVLEKEKFPRFHIGESLLPYNTSIFREMGVLQTLEDEGFMRKVGAQFLLASGAKKTAFVFRNGKFTRQTEAFQVERSKFDHTLLKHTAQCGARVLEEMTVTRFSEKEDQVEVEARDSKGALQTFQGKYLVDASGRGNFTGNQEGLRIMHPRLKKLSVFSHFKGVFLDEGEKAGDTVIVRLENKWFWLIPLSHEKVSVGVVMDAEEFKNSKKSPDAILDHWIQSSAVMRMRMANAERVAEVHTASDFSYRNRTLTSPRVLRVGDAAGFMDPIFSSGVFLAMHSGKLAAEAILQAIADPRSRSKVFQGYEKQVRHGMDFYWEMVENFYTKPFMELFMEPREKYDLASAVNAVLAGEVHASWAMRWRLRLFFWLVKAQARFPLVPRIKEF